MQTDPLPKKKNELEEYWRSDAVGAVELPPAEPLRTLAGALKVALKADDKKEVQKICTAMLKAMAAFYQVKPPKLTILNARPLTQTEKWVTELFGDYTPETTKIRLWMRTAVQQKPTSFGVLLNTLVHEFFHHLDMVGMDFPETFHTRGFYERVGLLYHHIQDTPVRTIVWRKNNSGTYTVDWAKTMGRK